MIHYDEPPKRSLFSRLLLATIKWSLPVVAGLLLGMHVVFPRLERSNAPTQTAQNMTDTAPADAGPVPTPTAPATNNRTAIPADRIEVSVEEVTAAPARENRTTRRNVSSGREDRERERPQRRQRRAPRRDDDDRPRRQPRAERPAPAPEPQPEPAPEVQAPDNLDDGGRGDNAGGGE